MQDKYVHGYTDYEVARLNDQASTLDHLLHHDTYYPPGSEVLELGCGVGAQTVILCRQCPDIRLTAVDISADSLSIAKKRCSELGFENVDFVRADLYDLPFAPESFDHIFVCFVLEHLVDVERALLKIKRLLRKNGTLTVIEGDHGSAYYYPSSALAQQTIECLIRLQAEAGGDSLIGRSLYPLLSNNGFKDVHVSPRMVYADPSRPEMVEGFTLKTFIAMVEGIGTIAIKKGLMKEDAWEKGIRELKNSAGQNGVFCYTFFKATASCDL